MGCGRSTLGSDSPKKRKKKAEADGECESDSDSGSNNSGSRKQQHGQQHQQQLINKFVPFGAGGPLLAQAKISDSQQDFFMMLDEKIENGPDYDSETEEVDRRRRLQEYADQWMVLTQGGRMLSPNNTTMLRVAPVKAGSSFPCDDASGSGDLTEEDEEEEEEDGLSEPERIPDEAVREQYMFMGNLYTLTHIRTDSDKTEPVVDVVAAEPGHEEERQVEHIELDHKLNGSAVPEEAERPQEAEHAEEAEGKGSSRPASRPTSRPASLILRSVFPSDVAQE
ncbi:nucleolin-like isoform X2 [Penaeus japonicus]|uniref:nucleolin-like isoform X2 n=1 Tax=Penaeus japonicus TaxID=27405 RepID=UPI001C70B20B|nr:nucleolin-like isoform X2 [Penaeus japonicus]